MLFYISRQYTKNKLVLMGFPKKPFLKKTKLYLSSNRLVLYQIQI